MKEPKGAGMQIEFKWIEIGQHTYRARVFGGWLVATNYYSDTASMVFVPDPEHKWMIGPVATHGDGYVKKRDWTEELIDLLKEVTHDFRDSPPVADGRMNGWYYHNRFHRLLEEIQKERGET